MKCSLRDAFFALLMNIESSLLINHFLEGKGTGFYMLRKMYEDKLDSQYPDVESLIKHELPKVADGMLGNAYHGIIQIGYGFIAGSNKVQQGQHQRQLLFCGIDLKDNLFYFILL